MSGWEVSEDMFDACWFLLTAFLMLLLLLLVVGYLPLGYFWLLLVTLVPLVPLVTLVTGTGIRIQKFCFSRGE